MRVLVILLGIVLATVTVQSHDPFEISDDEFAQWVDEHFQIVVTYEQCLDDTEPEGELGSYIICETLSVGTLLEGYITYRALGDCVLMWNSITRWTRVARGELAAPARDKPKDSVGIALLGQCLAWAFPVYEAEEEE